MGKSIATRLRPNKPTSLPDPKNFFFDENGVDWKKIGTFVQRRKVKAILIGPGMMNSPFDRNALEILVRLQKKACV